MRAGNNRGEAGLPEWFNVLKNKFTDWNIWVSSNLNDFEYNSEDLYEEL